MDKLPGVFIDSQCLRAMITSAIEVYNRESDGALIGKLATMRHGNKKKHVMHIKDIYVYQTDIRKPSQVYHGNIAAYKRVLNSLKSMEMKIVGGYHSHAFPYNCSYLSKDDISFALEELEAINKNKHHDNIDKWLEVLLSIRKWESRRKHDIGWHQRRWGKKMRITVSSNEFTKYVVFVSAYWITRTNGKPVVKEAKIYTKAL